MSYNHRLNTSKTSRRTMWWVVWLSRRLMFLLPLGEFAARTWINGSLNNGPLRNCWHRVLDIVTVHHASVALDWKWFRQCWLTHDVLSHAEGVVGYGTVTRQLGGFTTPACCVGYWKWFRQCWLTDVLSHAEGVVGYWNCHTPAKGGSHHASVLRWILEVIQAVLVDPWCAFNRFTTPACWILEVSWLT